MEMRLHRAIAAVVRASPETRQLVDQLCAAEQRHVDLREAVRELWRHHGALPDDIKNRNLDGYSDQGIVPSELAAAVKDWIARLKHDPEAKLNRAE
jgi:hypothetical protein